jgi:[acyl-carrier-protein] S-malonyltransferase
MGQELVAAFSVARETLEEIDDALGQNLSKLMAQGPAEELQLTENAQPALMALSMAVLRVLETEGEILIFPPAALSLPAIRLVNIPRWPRRAVLALPIPPGF